MSDSRSDRAGFTLEDLRSDAWTGDEDLTAFVADLERAYVSAVDLATESRHLTLILDELRSASWEPRMVRSASWTPVVARVRKRRRFRLALQLATALASATVFVGGFAAAHQGAPDGTPGQSVVTGAGNGAVVSAQAGSPAFVQTLLGYIETTSDEGCVFGQNVAAIASQGRGGNSDECSNGQSPQNAAGHVPQGSRATGQEHSAGRAGGTQAQGSRATGVEHSAGRAGGTQAPGSPATGTDHAADQADGAGGSEAQGDRATGEEHSEGATENAPVDIPKGPPTDL
ncbi:MAG: hypothetical protein ACRDI3_00110 [Actinomycetota bacterium]